MEKMNEDKMINALNSNVELGCLQTHFDKVGWHQLFEKNNFTHDRILAVSCLRDGEKNIPGKQGKRENPEEVCTSSYSPRKNSGSFLSFSG